MASFDNIFAEKEEVKEVKKSSYSMNVVKNNLFDKKVDDVTHIFQRIEGRTRDESFEKALSFEVYDPLWLMTRQWQFGRFEGNDCGSPVAAKVKVSKYKVIDNEIPLEYKVERMNRVITPFIRVESAIYLKKMIKLNNSSWQSIFSELCEQFPLKDVNWNDEESEINDIENLKLSTNKELDKFYKIYTGRIFDGYDCYLALKSKKKCSALISIEGLSVKYCRWFEKKYLPLTENELSAWNNRKLGYEVEMESDVAKYVAEDYHSGQLSWYSFDAVKKTSANSPRLEQKFLSYIPTYANYPAAPSKILWNFEDSKVQMGNLDNSPFSYLANAVIMQYTSMYGNDWLQIPLESEMGTNLKVEGIVVKDTFGEYLFIDKTPEENDNLSKATGFIDRWSMFGNTNFTAYQENDFSNESTLLFPPTLQRVEEGKPIEEISFLRDEMANMIWAVEKLYDGGYGSAKDGNALSESVLSEIDKQIRGEVAKDEDTLYSYILQNCVPLNWIPFIPQKIKGELREICFRRGRMPIFYNGKYQSVRPSTSLLRAIRKNGVIEPFIINEEEISVGGIKVILNAQRTRWYLGESFLWVGARKGIAKDFQTNSGLMFDELIDVKTNKAIKAVKKTI